MFKLKFEGMEKNVLLTYEAPVVEVIEVEVEKGFALSEQGNAPYWEQSIIQ